LSLFFAVVVHFAEVVHLDQTVSSIPIWELIYCHVFFEVLYLVIRPLSIRRNNTLRVPDASHMASPAFPVWREQYFSWQHLPSLCRS
jgi:hypothetical protein